MFNISMIGSIIKRERNELNDTLESFAPKVGISRQTLSRWENGQGTGPTVNDLLRMCELFNCDFGYLVGEYPCKRRQATDIQAEIGLLEESIETLRVLSPRSKRLLNDLLKNPSELEGIAYSYCIYRDMAQAFAEQKAGLHSFSGSVTYLNAQGDPVKIPISESYNYAQFEFLHKIQNFTDR